MPSAKSNLRLETPIQKACRELEQRIVAAEPCSARQILTESPDLAANRDSVLELIYTEFVVRQELGQNPSVDTWIGSFPEWESDLRELFQIHDLLGTDGTTAVDTQRATFTSSGETGGERVIPRGRRVGQYEILERVGQGGMGVVYRARQVGLGRVVALKMILSDDAGMRERARFRTEAEAAARLQHPNIVQIYEIGEHEGCPYLSMEYVEGGSLAECLTRSPPTIRLACEMVATLAAAMHYAHQRGVVHRDLKPANVLIADCGSRIAELETQSEIRNPKSTIPKITDFGLAKWLHDPDERSDNSHDFTHSGSVVGTPSYMAPEQIHGRRNEISPGTDVYALGTVLYEMLTGRPPFRGETAFDTLEQIRSQEPVSLRRLMPTLPRDLETICMKCLQKEPHKRYDTAQALADDLQQFLDGRPIRARPVAAWERVAKWARRRPAVAGLLATIALMSVTTFGLVTWAWWRAEANRIAAETSGAATVSALKKAELAVTAEQAERERLKRLLYDHDIALAHREYLANNLDRANQILEQCRPDLRSWEWDLLNRLTRAESLVLSGHTLPALRLDFSPDGKLIASSSGRGNRTVPGEVMVWDAVTGRNLFTFPAQRGPVRILAFTPDSRRLASTTLRDKIGITLWDLSNGTECFSIERPGVTTLGFSVDGQRFALGSLDGKVEIHESAKGQLLHQLSGHDGAVQSLCFNNDPTQPPRLATGSRDKTARIWDPRDGTQLYVLRNSSDVRMVEFTPNDSYLMTSTWSGKISTWDVQTGREIAQLQGNRGAYAFTISPDGSSFALSTGDQGIRILNVSNHVYRQTLPANHGGATSVRFSPDARRLAVTGYDRTARIWDLTEEPNPGRFEATGGAHVSDIAFSPNGKTLAVVSKRNRANPARGANDKNLRIWDLDSRRARVCQGHTDWLTCVAFSGNGLSIATGSLDQTVRVWNAQSGKLLHTLAGHVGAVTGVAFTPDGNTLVSAGDDGSKRIWDVATGGSLHVWLGHQRGVTCVVGSLRGGLVASSDTANTVKIWNPSTGETVADLNGHSAAVNYLAVRPDGELLASAGADGMVCLWDIEDPRRHPKTAQPLLSLRGHTEPVTGVSFSSDGKRLASITAYGDVKVWDISTGYEVLSLKSATSDSQRVLFSPDGRYLVASYSMFVRIWDSRADSFESDEARVIAETARASAWHRRELQDSESQQNWFAAAFHLTELIKLEPNQWWLHRHRGAVYAREARWRPAIDDYTKVFQLQAALPATDSKVKPLQSDLEFLCEYAALLLLDGGNSDFRNLCASTLPQFDTREDHRTAYLLARIGSLSPDPDVAATRSVELAQIALNAEPGWPWYHHTIGLAYLRQGKATLAIDHFRRALELRPEWISNPLNWLGLAIAHRALGNVDESRQWLEKATEWFKTTQEASSGANFSNWHPHDWLSWHLLWREAEAGK